MWRVFYDFVMYYALVRPLGRVPARDSRLAWRVRGPGVSSMFYYQIEPDLAILMLQAHMEKNQLEVFSEFMMRKIEEPEYKYYRAGVKYFSHFGGKLIDHQNLDAIINRNQQIINDLKNKVEERHQMNPFSSEIRSGNVRQTASNLTKTIQKGTVLVDDFYLDKVFPFMTEKDITEFWNAKGLKKDDWKALTQLLLSEIFGEKFFVPLEDTQNIFSLKVSDVNVESYVSDLWKEHSQKEIDEVVIAPVQIKKMVPHTPLVRVETTFYPPRVVNFTVTAWKPSLSKTQTPTTPTTPTTSATPTTSTTTQPEQDKAK
eukprot:TRINITY_DN1005_c1_g1_i3.p1 TRINITY_DN1005_c1_g1~~TRINITY_DN1005_c1_g1_i3.p1  ORF type:complete len:315 (-),score=85.53 TRINITY_DN1005_c1_g1_i3:21-965(-)